MPIAIASASIIVCILYVFVNISFFCVLPRVILIQKNLVGNFINILKINDTIKTILPYFINIIPSFGTLNGSYMVGMSIIEAYVLEFLSKNQKNPKTEKNKANITAQIESEINEDYKKSFNETENYEEHQEKHVEIVNSSHVSSDIDDTPKSEKSLLCNAPFLKFLGISLYSMIVIVFLQVNSKSIIEKLSFMIYLFYGLSLVALLVLRKKDKNRERLYKVPSILVYLCISFSVILFLNTLYYILKPMFPK
ncbi:hypothetical protein EDEG_01432 [Edhazardia aedis USNM 41457]|uniref:Amino acid transporter transmembrane domain-containing protein n=1 Tax=Edhazardia aedis (strain USNM 41457) TaxID=1003232 RepID=J8ZX95_EDHAE|nr:hypothetical protein EDEG_01432 [Edhazardia aedis USNM 41457]|eukprot:EJW04308.1 hypothetical protein EDEG_01432 [Edhazardia aedis USNM 41457]